MAKSSCNLHNNKKLQEFINFQKDSVAVPIPALYEFAYKHKMFYNKPWEPLLPQEITNIYNELNSKIEGLVNTYKNI